VKVKTPRRRVFGRRKEQRQGLVKTLEVAQLAIYMSDDAMFSDALSQVSRRVGVYV